MIQDALETTRGNRAKAGRPPRLAQWLRTISAASIEHACRLVRFSRTAWYRPRTGRDQTAPRLRFREPADTRPRFGADFG